MTEHDYILVSNLAKLRAAKWLIAQCDFQGADEHTSRSAMRDLTVLEEIASGAIELRRAETDESEDRS